MAERKLEALLVRYLKLLELSRDLSSTLDLNTLLGHLVHAAANLSHAEAASILLYDEPKNLLYFEATTNLDTPQMRGLVVPVDSSLAGWVLTHRSPVIISDTQSDPRHFGLIAQETNVVTTSLLGVPLITKDKVIGVLEAINKLEGAFNHDDQELLMALGSQAAVAIENARLFQQSDMIAELIHELRTPLTSLQAGATLISRPEIHKDQRSLIVDTMQNEIRRLINLTSDFLDLARMESGRSHLELNQTDIKQLLDECIVLIHGELNLKGQHLQLEIPDNIPMITVDRDKLKQVIENLLTNASKYTHKGGSITLEAKTTAHDLLIRIEDTGTGIPAEYVSHIFEKFYRVPGTENSGIGTGLGLSICKRIIDMHNGRIEVESQMGEGSSFTISIPLHNTRSQPVS